MSVLRNLYLFCPREAQDLDLQWNSGQSEEWYKHAHFEQNYPQNTEVRTTKLNQLKSLYQASSRIIVKSMTKQEQALRVAWVPGKHKKPFLDTELIKECMSDTMEAMLEGKQKDEMKENESDTTLQQDQLRFLLTICSSN